MKTRSLVSFLAAICAASSLWADNGTWTAASGGTWSDPANWAVATPATGSTYTATFTTGSGTVNNDLTDLALRGVQLSGSGFTLAGNTLTLDSAGFITVLSGSHTLSLPLALSGSTTLAAASAQTLTVGGAVSGNGGLTIYGGRVVLGNAANSYTGATVLVTGILEVASVAALGSSPADPANLVLGDGLFRYTGASVTLSRGFTLAPTNFGNNRAIIIDVTNANTTLTVAGKVATPNGSFIKTGNGTLIFTYPGSQELSKSRLANGESGVITYDANGIADTNSYALFNVDKGRMILGVAGQTNVIYGDAWVGSRTLASPRLDLVGGVTKFPTGYFTIGRGTGTSGSVQNPSMYLSGGAYAEITGSGLVLDNANGQSAHYCRPILSLDNATLKVTANCFLSENGNATTTVSVANNALFQSDQGSQVGGFSISQTAGARTDVTFSNSSTGRVYQARVALNGTLNVLSGSVFEMDTTPTNVVAQKLNLGVVKFNTSTLAQRTAKLVSDWFVGVTNVFVGAGGMTLDVASQAWLDPQVIADPASPGGSLIKTGNGTLVLRNTDLAMQVNAGRVAFAIERPQMTNQYAGAVTFGAGSSAELSAAGGAGGLRLNVSGTPLTLTPHSLVSNPDLWWFSNSAMRRPDGILQLTPESGNYGAVANQKGGAFLVRKQTVSGPWTATFSYICWATGATPADGAAFVIQNDPRGVTAIGAFGASLGYADTTASRITNSIAVGIDVNNHQIRFGRQGTLVDTRALPAALPKLGSVPLKTKFTVSYDGAGLMTVLIDRPGSISYGYTWAVNIPAEVGANDAYLGFTAGTGGRYGQHSVTDVLFNNGTVTPPSYCRYGGRITLGSSETLTTFGNPSTQQRGFVLGSLAYADQSVIQADASAAPSAPPAPTLADQGMWKLNQYANWKPDGRLAVSTNNNNSNGSAFTTNTYPIAGSWTARFGYDIGLTSTPPADYVTFTVQNSSPASTSHTPNPGFAIMWRYYENGTNTTWVKMYTNGVMVIATNNIAPVSLINGQHANMTVDYNAVTKTVMVITSQPAGAFTNFFTGVDMLGTVGSTSAYLGFGASTGGLNAENIVSDFSFSSAAVAAASGGTGYLAFDKLSGSGTLIKRGIAALGLMGDMDLPTSNLTVRLEQGGLVLRKNNLEPLSVTGARSDWVFTPEGKWGDDGTLQFCAFAGYAVGTVTTSRRVRVKEPWTLTYSFLFGARSNPPADAYSFFLHNDPRGPGAVGSNTGSAGYAGTGAITKSIGFRWYFYPNGTSITNTIAIGRNGVIDDGASRQSYAPITLYNGVTAFIIKYNPTAATLTSIMTQGAVTITNTFTSVNIPTDVGSDYAYVGFGGGCGGSYGEMRVRDFTMTYDTPLTDLVADQTCLASLTLPAASTNTVTLDTSIASGSFKITAATVGSGATLGLAAAVQPGTLAVGSVTQSGDATYPVAAGCTLVMSNVVGGATFTKTGAGTLTLKGGATTYTGNTVLNGGTLSTDAARLPIATDLYVTNSPTLNLAFTGKQYVHRLLIDGVQQHGGQYTSLNAPSLISGPGTLVVTYPPVCTLIMVR